MSRLLALLLMLLGIVGAQLTAVGGEKLSFSGDVKKDMISKKGVVEIQDLAGGESGPDVGTPPLWPYPFSGWDIQSIALQYDYRYLESFRVSLIKTWFFYVHYWRPLHFLNKQSTAEFVYTHTHIAPIRCTLALIVSLFVAMPMVMAIRTTRPISWCNEAVKVR